MRRLIPLALAGMAALAPFSTAQAQTAQARPAAQQCSAPDYSASHSLQWFLGINPRDSLVAVWCRLQTLPGAIRFNVLFLNTQAHRSWDTSFQGAGNGPEKIVEIVQSLMPVPNGPVRDDKGMPFGRVLQKVVQLAADEAPDGTTLGFASTHPAAKELVLWEPLVMRVRPVSLAGQEFTLKILMRPDLGWLAYGLQDPRFDLRFKGWAGRMDVGTGSLFGGGCSSAIPFCENLGEMPVFHTPWIVEQVILQADGEAMTASAATIANQLGANYANFLPAGNGLGSFDPKTGKGSMTITDGLSNVEFQAEGGSSGTNMIKITYQEVKDANSVTKHLKDTAERFRAAGAAEKKAPTVPDSLGRL
ncbi:hypothetical protein G6L37_02090 [Agrobacterium rubi]|nr:hypothetical protein [Agrobacterium rubi]NTF24184.1 hypothetical protein [Agrobacterium rubi]